MSQKHSFKNGDRVYHLALIDFLQEWNTQKKCERLIKTTLLGKNKENLSAIEPVKYAARFKRFCEKSVFVYQEDHSIIAKQGK